MIKLENTEVIGWEHAIRGMRNPKNSWDRSDSGYCENINVQFDNTISNTTWATGPNDHKLMMQLAAGGPVHAKYRRMITVYVDITAPLYWWKEFDTYKVGTVANSCSTMHKIHDKEFTLEDFSCEHLFREDDGGVPDHEEQISMIVLKTVIKSLNYAREAYLDIGDMLKTVPINEPERRKRLIDSQKKAWWQMIQLLPSSYNQKRTVMLNYEVLAGIYPMRKNHKLDEWRVFCEWIESLPYSEIIIGKEKEK